MLDGKLRLREADPIRKGERGELCTRRLRTCDVETISVFLVEDGGLGVSDHVVSLIELIVVTDECRAALREFPDEDNEFGIPVLPLKIE